MFIRRFFSSLSRPNKEEANEDFSRVNDIHSQKHSIEPTPQTFVQQINRVPVKQSELLPQQTPMIEKIPEVIKDDGESTANLFIKYRDIGREEDGHEENYITVSGLVKFAQDLGVDAEDVVMLVVLYKIGSTKQYVVSEYEWNDGWRNLGCSNLSQMRNKLPSLRKELDNKSTFKPIYMFAFDYNKVPDQKAFANEDAVSAWRLLLTGRYGDIEKWCTFVQDEFKKAVPRDTWQLFFDFAMDVGTDLNRYNASDAWPLLIDNYVEYLKEKNLK